MFLKSIHIKNYRQFENLELDLTHPKGHKKEGERLEKICIIGDNGTGKTTILELILDYYHRLSNSEGSFTENGIGTITKEGESTIVFKNEKEAIVFSDLVENRFSLLNFPTGIDLSKLDYYREILAVEFTMSKIKKEIENETTDPLNEYFSAFVAWQKLIKKIDSPLRKKVFKRAYCRLTGNKVYIFTEDEAHSKLISSEPHLLEHFQREIGKQVTGFSIEIIDKESSKFNSHQTIVDFDDDDTVNVWNFLKSKIQKSIDKELAYRLESLKEMKNQNDVNELKEYLGKIEKFKIKTPNGYDQLAEFLKPVLSKFHLELNTKFDLEKFNQIKFLDLRAKDGTIIPIERWSTGIKQLIYTIFPLYTLKPDTGIIMIDEAENSLYPNTQRIIIDFYKSICPKMQLIIATHSPILASSFEPWEVIELRFNENGKVERKPYYKGEENHVDNYHIHPMYLRWDTLFEEMFGVEGEGNDARTKMRTKLSILDREMEKANGKAEKKKLFEKYSKVAELLDWKTLDDA